MSTNKRPWYRRWWAILAWTIIGLWAIVISVFIGLIISGAIGSSGSTTKSAPIPQGTVTVTPSSSLPAAAQGSGTPAGGGNTFTFYDDQYPDFKLAATADRTKALQKSNWFGNPEYIIGAHLTIENLGQQSYDDDLSSSSVVALYDTNGNSYSSTDGMITEAGDSITFAHALHHVHVLPGESVSGWVYFKSDSAINPLSFAFAPNDTQDGITFKPGEWPFQ